ncbi:Eco57I restriction-modification methylase domain-containing protein, partial [Ardenticatena maritima]
MDNRDRIQSLIRDFSPESLTALFRQIAPTFRPRHETFNSLIKQGWPFDDVQQLGVIELPGQQTVLIGAIRVSGELTARSSKKKQYELGKRILKAGNHNAGIFAFYDDRGRFRLSLITVTYSGTHRQFSTFRRYTFFVDPDLPNKTFVNQIGRANFSSLEGILDAFALEAVSDAFYQEFKPKYDAIAADVQGTSDEQLKQDFALLFVIRTIFLGFVQKKGWLGDKQRFLQDFWQEYQSSGRPRDTFYKEWLEPLFFEALNNPPGYKVAYGRAPFSEETQNTLQMAPYLNGELFKRKKGIDDQGLWIPDELIRDFFDFLFQYNFTVEENELYDEELELNPEFLGIIFERLTNKDQGAVYTPRVEVDLMCRLALVKWLEKTTGIEKEDLYHLFFREAGTGEEFDEYQKQGDFSPAEIRTLIEKLESVTVCDPAAGSGAFEVGMLQVLDQTLENLYSRNNTPADLKAKAPTPFERKKAIIERSLYGVEVKRWAVWINHLRLWLTLFVDMPDDYKTLPTPLLPNLTFKVRTGDSLVQRLGDKTFPVQGHANLSPAIKRQITDLKKKKREFFYNQNHDAHLIEQAELAVFRAILDEQIEERRKEINRLQQPPAKNLSFLEDVAADEAARQAEERKKRKAEIAALEAEIAELEAQKRSLKDERPFIWSIEFAEIFFDRGGFDIIIGNPPYLAAHSKDEKKKIRDPNGLMPPKEYKNALDEMMRLDFPDYFAKSRAQTDKFKKERKPSGRSDLYTYFYIRSLRLLNPQGVHVFICSNSWLDASYGAWLQEFFLRKTPMCFVIDNHAKRSFARADVNTVITVAGAPLERGAVPGEHVVRFVAFKQPFEDAVLSENLLAIENATDILKTDAFRVFPITVADLLAEGSDDGRYMGDKWGGKYLRAPNVFLKILKSRNYFRVKDVARVLGYVHDNNVSDRYPSAPFIKSIRDIRKITIAPEDVTWQGVSTKGETRVKGDLLFARTFDNVHLILWNKNRFVIGKEFYRILAERIEPKTLALLLNSTLAILQRELFGLHNLGGGAIKFNKNDVELFILPKTLNRSFENQIFDKFLNREIY